VNPRIVVAALSLSAVGLIGIATHEGWRDTPYLDAVGVKTVGFGSTTNIQGRISVEQGLIRLGSDVSKHEAELRDCLGDTKLYQREWDALASWAFNVGVRCDSTLIRKAKAGDYAGMCAELLRWNRAGGKVLSGLTKRRQAEYAVCMGL
jgi:lysozyme